ncbi:hypothetical protein A5717_19040 [Mycolicibacterium porcinum]|nr:hypothetical protein A5717_19040 [Mycolicibacterium porcinum]
MTRNAVAGQYGGSTPKARFHGESMNQGRHGNPAMSMPSARTIAMSWILLPAMAIIMSSVTTGDNPATNPIGISAPVNPGSRIPLNDCVAIT